MVTSLRVGIGSRIATCVRRAAFAAPLRWWKLRVEPLIVRLGQTFCAVPPQSFGGTFTRAIRR